MSEKQNKNSLIWFKNNLRIYDNEALSRAITESETVIAIYCFNPNDFKKDAFGFKKTEKFRAKFLIETITDLKQQLLQLNIALFVYFKQPQTSINLLNATFNFDALYLQKEWTQEENDCFKAVKQVLNKPVKIIETYDQFLYHPEDITFNIAQLPKVFTVFRKQVEKESTIRKEISFNASTKNTKTIKNDTVIPTLNTLGFEAFEIHKNTAFPFKGGENEALKRLNKYFFKTKKISFYKKTRNGLIGTDFSSKFSPWLANGSLSAKTIYWKIKQFEKEHYKNESTYWLIFELIWRDYFKYISIKHHNKIFKISGILEKNYQWDNNTDKILKWINGKTKEPFVNANMIELKKTGWMSNRGRQNVASYFAKELNIDWRIGAAYFESFLIDYDVHSNYGNWMYFAGVGNDPRDRKFNIKMQAERYDGSGKHQRLWLQDTLF